MRAISNNQIKSHEKNHLSAVALLLAALYLQDAPKRKSLIISGTQSMITRFSRVLFTITECLKAPPGIILM
jgi:hypothetical protein